jgi:hypothetical protein
VCAALAIGAVAQADDAAVQPSQPPPAEDTKAIQAGGHLKQGKAYFDAHVYEEAIKEFEASYALVANPAIRFTIAEAFELKGDPKSALAEYKKYLSLVTETELTDTARTKVAALTKQVAETDIAKQNWDTDRERRRHGRKVGNIFIWGVGAAGAIAAIIGGGVLGDGHNADQGPGLGALVGGGVVFLVGVGYGLPKRLLNSDRGEFHMSVSVGGGVKSLVLSRSF